MDRVNWQAVMENAEWRELDGADRSAFGGAGPQARIAEVEDLVIVTDLVERDDEVRANEWERARVFQAFDESGEMVGELRLPGFVN